MLPTLTRKTVSRVATALVAGVLLCLPALAAADPSRPAASPSQAVYGQVGDEEESLGPVGPGGGGGGAGVGDDVASASAGGDAALPFTGYAAALVLGSGLALLILGASGRTLAGRLRRG